MNQARDFWDDLSFGRRGETLMSNFFIMRLNSTLKNHKYSIVETGDGKSWDVKALAYPKMEDGRVSIFPDETRKPLHIEIKTDVYHHKTNNMFIELKSRGRKSGLDTSKSDFFVYFFIRKDLYPQNNVWIISTKLLKELVEKYRLDPKYIKRGGDNNSSEGVLLPLQEVTKYFKVLTYTEYEMEYGKELGVETKVIIKKKIGFEF